MLCAMEMDGGESFTPGTRDADADVIRLRPLNVLIVSPDRRFRSVVEMLLARRECSSYGVASAEGVAETIARERVDVALVEGMRLLRELAADVAQSAAVAPPVGVVLVADSVEPGLSGPLALAKWSGFDELFAAVVEADRARARPAVAAPAERLGVAGARKLG
jgi:hypothetical protein